MAHIRGSKFRSVAWIVLLLIAAVAGLRAESQAASGYSEYIIPGNEGATTGTSTQLGIYYILSNLDASATSNMHSVISVTAWAPNTTLYFDHWEDGYDFDPNNPSTADETVVLATTGAQKTFESANFTIPRTATTPGTGCNTVGNCVYDGGDRIYVAGGTVTVTRAGWIEGVGVGNQAVAWEIYPVKPQLTTYVLPFGENLGQVAFSRVYALIQATADNTTFQVDLNGDGTFDLLNTNRNATKSAGDGDTTTITLNTGQTFLLDRISACTTNTTTCDTNPGTLNAGAVIQGSSTLQVKFVAGNPGQTYCARGLSAFPRGYWTKTYYAPLGNPAAGSGTDYFLHNPNATALTVNWESRTTSGSFSIPARSTVSFVTASVGAVPTNSGLYFSASDVFWGVGLNDRTGATYEWGYSLLPSTFLYTEHYLGWAPGFVGGTGTARYDDDGVFLTPAQDNTRVFVDYNSDGVADVTYTLNRLQTQYIYDPNDGDMSGAHIWATGLFTLAYGENSDTASTSTPSLDLGYVAIPGTDFLSLVLGVQKSVSPQIVPTTSGSTADFTLVTSTKEYSLDAASIVDTLPPDWAYVPGSTTITRPDLSTVTGGSADPAISGSGTLASPYVLTWSAAQLDPSGMGANQKITVTFTGQTTTLLAAGTLSQNRVVSTGTRTVGSPAVTQTFSATDFVYVTTGELQITKASSAPTPLYPGDSFGYTVTVTNPAGAPTQTGVSLFDAIPAGISYVAGSGSVTCERQLNVRDEFATAAYTNNGPNNTANWATDWAETDEYGTGPDGSGAGAAGGFVRITGGQLQFRYALSTVADQFASAAYNLNTGSDNWAGNWTESAGLDGVATGTPNQDIYITTGGRLRLDHATGNTFAVSRTANVPAGSAVTITFTPYDSGFDGGEAFVAEYSVDGGAFTIIGTYDGGTGGWSGNQVTSTIASFPGSTITLRFRATGAWSADNDHAEIDNVQISYGAPANASGTAIQRTANLTGAVNPSLSFTATAANLEAADTLVVEAATSAAGPFTILATYAGGTPSAAGPYDLTPYVSATTTIRFRVTGGYDVNDETMSIDNVDIAYFGPSTFASGTPPDFLSSAVGCRIRGGNALTLTFNVTVDNPFPAGPTLVTNTAATTSTQLPVQLTASVTNQVTIPAAQSASVAGRVWLDANSDGVQDIGEPGLSNVEVTLKDQFGAPVATLTTDANGRYLFTGVTPGTGYYVEVASGLPAGVTQSYPSGRTDNRTASFNLASGQAFTGVDLGYKPAAGTATFGDLVWVDANGNQLRDPGEVGLGGVRVRLYRDGNADGFLDPLVDALVGEPATGPGKVSVTNGSTTVTGVSTRFTTLAAGDPITIAGVRYTIASVTSDTQLTLGAAYTGTTATSLAYTAGTAEATGTVSATNGSTAVTGTGTNFTSLIPGDEIVIRGVRYTVASVTDATHLTLTGSFTGTTGIGLPFGLANATYSAADGSYLFAGAPASGTETYFVSATGPAGYVATTGAVSRYFGVASGSVLLTADFGFQASGTTYSISDRVWLDADADMYFDGGAAEPGIGGVTVDLLDASLNVVGTTTTAADGTFTFNGLAGSGADYTIRLSDASGVLSSYSGTTPYATARERSEPNLTGNVDRRTAATWPNGPSYGFLTTRAIGDSVYYDVNGNGTQDPGENGFAGVVVSLYRDVDGSGTISLSSQATNVSVTAGSATVTGTGTSFRNYHAGEPILVNGIAYTIASIASATSLTLTTNATATYSGTTWSGPSAGPGTVSTTNGSTTVTGTGTSFLDYRAGEPITINGVVYTIASVASSTSLTLTTNATANNTNVPYYGPGDSLVSTVTTGTSGQFLFAGLPARSYLVSVPVPGGYNYIPGARTDVDSTFPGIQLAATISGAANVLDRDFGFQAPSAGGVQGTIWNDTDGNGTIGGTEAGRYAGVTVEVLSGSTVVATLTTDANGFYSVGGLAVGTYTVRVTDVAGILTGTTATTPTSTSVSVTANTNSTADFGFRTPTPTYASVSSFKASLSDGTVVVEWQTTQEVGTVGFHLLRFDRKAGDWVQVDESLLPGLQGHPEGGTYTFRDTEAPVASPLAYKLVEVDAWGTQREYGPWRFRTLPPGAPVLEPYRRTAAAMSNADVSRSAVLRTELADAAQARSRQKASRVKIGTKAAGLHYIDTATLAGLLGEKPNSLSSRVGSGRVVLENLGSVVPYSPAAGGAGLYFYAERIDSPYTDENVYWFSTQKGPMMTTSAAQPTGRAPEPTFPETVHNEVDRYPLPAFFQDPGADFYAWDYLYAGYPGEDTRTFVTTLRGVAGTGQPTLTVRLQGGSDTDAPAEHRVRITWNGRIVGEAGWDGIVPHEIVIPLGAADVVEGSNTLVLTAILNPGLDYDVVYVDSFDVSYPRAYRAVDDELAFTLPAGADAAVAGFSSPTMVVLDVTTPEVPVLVAGAAWAPGDGTYGVRFANRGATTRSYLAVTPARARQPVRMVPREPAGLSASTNGADDVFLAPSSLLVATESLAAYRRSRGLASMVVDLEDVHDEFGFGLATPIAVQDFLAHATASWSRPPQFVTLVGRGTFDYKDAQGVGDNVMPTLLVGTPFGLAASDVSFAPLSTAAGRGVKAIGRLPVLTSQELLDYVAKVQAHESASAAAWQNNLLLTADNPDAGGAFTDDSDAVGALAPTTFLKSKVYLTAYSASDARTAIRNTVNSGALLFNYIGHGSPDHLADENIFNKADVPFLTNAGRLPVFLAMTCSTGNFAIPGFPSLGESIVLWKSGGAYATWAPSGLSLNDGAKALNEAFFHGYFVDGEKVVGRNCTKALEGLPATGPTSYMKAIYNVIGEPVTRLP